MNNEQITSELKFLKEENQILTKRKDDIIHAKQNCKHALDAIIHQEIDVEFVLDGNDEHSSRLNEKLNNEIGELKNRIVTMIAQFQNELEHECNLELEQVDRMISNNNQHVIDRLNKIVDVNYEDVKVT